MGRLGMPANLFWKELRELFVVSLFVLVIGVLVPVELAPRLVGESVQRLSVSAWMLLMLGSAVLHGSLFFGIERLHGTRSFLLSLPIGPGSLMAGKLGASACGVVGVVVGSRLLLGLDSGLTLEPIALAEWPGVVASLGLAWVLAARASVIFREALAVVLGTLALLPLLGVAVGSVSVRIFGSEVVPWTWTEPVHGRAAAIALGLLALLLVELYFAIRRSSDDAPGFALPRLALGGFAGRWPLLRLELRRKGFLALVLLVVPPIWALRFSMESTHYLLQTWILLAGAILGSVLFDADEKSGSASLIHQMPIPRWQLVGARFAWALVIGLSLLLQQAACLYLDDLVGPGMGLSPEAWIARVLGLQLCLFLISFGLAALLSPWLGSTVLGTSMALATILALMPGVVAKGVRQELMLVVAVALGMAFWSTVRSRAFEPMSAKNVRGLLLLLPFWVWALARING